MMYLVTNTKTVQGKINHYVGEFAPVRDEGYSKNLPGWGSGE
jgi:hypothetical protein